MKEGFAKLLFGLAAETREQHERGCLLLSANLQRDTRDAAIADFLRDNQARVEAIFVEALRRAQTRGELSRTHKPAALAHFFVVTIQGMRTTARLTSDRKALEQVARIALAVFSEGSAVATAPHLAAGYPSKYVPLTNLRLRETRPRRGRLADSEPTAQRPDTPPTTRTRTERAAPRSSCGG